jgi:hypothetical protein
VRTLEEKEQEQEQKQLGSNQQMEKAVRDTESASDDNEPPTLQRRTQPTHSEEQVNKLNSMIRDHIRINSDNAGFFLRKDTQIAELQEKLDNIEQGRDSLLQDH